MEKPDMILINRQTLSGLIRKQYRAANMILLLEFLCRRANLKMDINVKDACFILQIKPELLDMAREKNWIKYTELEGSYRFDAYEIAVLAEKLKWKRNKKAIDSIPSFREQ